MATRTTTKTKPHKAAPAKKKVKSAVSHKPAAKAKPAKAAAPAKPARVSHAAPPAKPHARHAPEKVAPPHAPARRASVESVSLIDKEKPQPKGDHQEKVKRTVLPPISRIRESLKAPPAAVAKPEPPPPTEAKPSA